MKKNKFFYTFFFIGLCFYVNAQNLVPNYSFEDTIQCISGWGQFGGYVMDWTGGSPAYFTSECSESEDSVPLNWWGYQYAHTGHAYAGIYTYVSDTCSTCPHNNKNLRDYIQDKLTNSLTPSMKYYVTFYVCPADTSWYYCNSVGAYFSDSALSYAKVLQYVKSYINPQIENDEINNPLTHVKTWIKVSGSFVAQGGEKYVVIGNFKNDSTSSIVYKGEVSTTEPDAFYYIDDVIVSPDSNYADSLFSAVQNVTKPQAEVKVFPNPANNSFNIEIDALQRQRYNLCLYNAEGQKVICETLTNNVSRLVIENLPSGIYLYRITNETGKLIKSDKVMIAH